MAAKILVSVLALWVLWRTIESEDLFRVLASADPVLVAAVVALYLMGQALTAYRWKVIADRLGFRHRLREMTRFYFIGMFFNLFGVSTVGGDLVRSLYLGQRDNRRTLAFHTVLFDRLSGLAMLVLVAVAALLLFGRYDLPWPLVALTVAAGAGLTIGWWIVPPLARRIFSPGSRMLRLIEEDLEPFWRDRQLLIRAAWVSSSFHVLQVFALILLGRSIHMQVEWRYYFIFHPLVTVLSAMPVSLAGLGIREMGYVWFLKRQGVPADTAFAFGLLWFAVLTISSLSGGLVYLLSGASVPVARSPRGRQQQVPTLSDP
ncbi:MAG TPA: lysylphosphatidylglycerol synthase transmembrane domain-containing protein [Candidatus Binatia bacterium]|nr:lysylphosphatidylglycerol synthase transmembrane domain-containing protein [Candidatus Binatia bacterium]